VADSPAKSDDQQRMVSADGDSPPTGASGAWVDLSSFSNPDYDPGRGTVVRLIWHYVGAALFESGLMPSSGLKAIVLRLFGGRIGRGLVIKPNVRIKYPWKLSIGDHCWIGQGAWIDNLDDVSIGNHVCVSQLVYLCTGSHDYRRRTFDLITKPIRIEDGARLGARCTILQGVAVGENALVAGGSLVSKDVPAATIVGGNPARPISRREPPVG
jgi:putative colanic acid biosynthesis acetyltransferase WcaF